MSRSERLLQVRVWELASVVCVEGLSGGVQWIGLKEAASSDSGEHFRKRCGD